MSRIVLGWQLSQPVEDAQVHEVMQAIGRRYQPLFEGRLASVGLWEGTQGLVHCALARQTDAGLELTVDRITCLTGRPTVSSEVGSSGTSPLGAAELRRRLAPSGAEVRADEIGGLNPPFTLCWFDRSAARLGVIHDGLGEDQFFVAETAAGVAFSNRCWPILKLLGLAPRLDRSAWRYWFCLGWFPGESTPYAGIRFLGPGEILVGDTRSLSSTRAGALAHWIRRGEPGNSAVWMDRAAASVSGLITQNRPTTGIFEADLTGGLDSRAICAMLRRDAQPCRYYTGGPTWSPDVMLARRIARRLSLDWTHEPPPHFTRQLDLREVLDAKFRDLMIWGEGMVEAARFQHFSGAPSPTHEGVYLSGGASEISRGCYYRPLLDRDPDARFDLDGCVNHIMHIEAGLLRGREASDVREQVRERIRDGSELGLSDWALVDHFYLLERVRRWQSAHLASNLFDVTVLPFLTADHITLAFLMQPRDRAQAAFQRYIIRQGEPGLLGIPLTARAPAAWRLAWWIMGRRWPGKPGGWADHFRNGGRESIEQIFARDAPHWEIVDRSNAMTGWTRFTRGSSQSVRLPLSLLAFAHWHDRISLGLGA